MIVELMIGTLLFVIIIALYNIFLRYGWDRPHTVHPVTDIGHTILGFNEMRVADIELFWELSLSTDVKNQIVTVTHSNEDGVETNEIVLVAEQNTVTIVVPEKTGVNVAIVVDDGTFKSVPTNYSFVVGDLTEPQPVDGLGHRILAIRDLPDEPVEEVDLETENV